MPFSHKLHVGPAWGWFCDLHRIFFFRSPAFPSFSAPPPAITISLLSNFQILPTRNNQEIKDHTLQLRITRLLLGGGDAHGAAGQEDARPEAHRVVLVHEAAAAQRVLVARHEVVPPWVFVENQGRVNTEPMQNQDRIKTESMQNEDRINTESRQGPHRMPRCKSTPQTMALPPSMASPSGRTCACRTPIDGLPVAALRRRERVLVVLHDGVRDVLVVHQRDQKLDVLEVPAGCGYRSADIKMRISKCGFRSADLEMRISKCGYPNADFEMISNFAVRNQEASITNFVTRKKILLGIPVHGVVLGGPGLDERRNPALLLRQLLLRCIFFLQTK